MQFQSRYIEVMHRKEYYKIVQRSTRGDFSIDSYSSFVKGGYVNILRNDDFKAVQPINTKRPIDMSRFRMVIFLRALQYANASPTIDMTLLGMVIEVRALQPPNAQWPIDVTLLGMVIEVRALQSANA